MKTTMQNDPSGTTLPARARACISSVAMLFIVCAVSGCQSLHPSPTPPPPLKEALVGHVTNCPSGYCDPGDPNGLGIYVVEGGNYCFRDASGRLLFCPEAFINIPPQTVQLEGQAFKNGVATHRKLNVSAIIQGKEVPVVQIDGNNGDFAIRYVFQGTTSKAQGASLSRLMLKFKDVPGEHIYLMKFEEDKPQDPLHLDSRHRYQASYREGLAAAPWTPYCTHPYKSDPNDPNVQKEPVSFLPGYTVNSKTAELQYHPEATTMACESGAIATCLTWRYTPWDPATAHQEQNHATVYASCLQAKRAAYFVRFGDYKSYTANGTLILKQDQYGYGKDQDTIDASNIEALWSPGGAMCLTKQHQRRADLFIITNYYGVPECPLSPPQWTDDAKLATGKTGTQSP